MAGIGIVMAALRLAAPFGMVEVDPPSFPAAEFSVADYPTFNAAIDACAAAGGGRVIVPSGIWTSGAVHLKSNVELHLDEGAVLAFPDDPADCLPAVQTSWEGVECYNYSPLIYAFGCTNVAITGKGTLSPVTTRWMQWWDEESMAAGYARERLYTWCSKGVPVKERDLTDSTKVRGNGGRPQLVQMNRCQRVLLDGFTVTSSPFWCLHLLLCDGVLVRNVTVSATEHNSDGIDIEMTRNVIVEGCSFRTGDDGMVIKAGRNHDGWRLATPSENIVITNCVVHKSNNLLAIGSELSGGVRNVLITGITGASQTGLYIKTNYRRGGFVEDVWMKNVDVTAFDHYVMSLETDVLYQWNTFPTYATRYTPIRGIHVSGVHAGKCGRDLYLKGERNLPAENITVDGVTIDKYYTSGIVKVVATNVVGLSVNGVAVEVPCEGCEYAETDWFYSRGGSSGLNVRGSWNSNGEFVFDDRLPSGYRADVFVRTEAYYRESLPDVGETPPIAFTCLMNGSGGLIPYGAASGLWHRLDGAVLVDGASLELGIGFVKRDGRWCVRYSANGTVLTSDGCAELPLSVLPKALSALGGYDAELNVLRGVLSPLPNFSLFLR